MSTRIHDAGRDWDRNRERMSPPPTAPPTSCLELLAVTGAALAALYFVCHVAVWALTTLLEAIT